MFEKLVIRTTNFINKKIKIFLSTLVFILLIGFFFLFNQPDKKLHIYFCDVGQGDAIYIRIPNGQDMLIDGGPGRKVLDCLAKYMPFYDRKINVVMLTHPQADHLNGLIPVLERYKVSYFVGSPVDNPTISYQNLKNIINKKGIEVKNLYSGNLIDFGEIKFKFIWPEKEWVITHLNCQHSDICQTVANSYSSVLGISTSIQDINKFSEMGILTYGNFDLLLAGDGDSQIQDEILKFEKLVGNEGKIEVMKVPHHGAKTALNTKFLETFKPLLAVISVGKNSYGHPSQEIINKLEQIGAKVIRTDQKGDIEIISDGKTWKIGKSAD